ncbi:MAG: ribonuclease III [Lachnospiraceae bacterium]|jgi:ribonuclease-3|nr:ribonuclease III [Lachnospiraceae bacterium]HBV81600.1 ribonuclease III [Lachnospiraceae bacterium]
MTKALQELQEKIGYQFHEEVLLKQALTHSSFANEQKINKLKNYERLEFLGDAVLELISSEFLYNENVDMPEGQLTRLRASMVCEPALAYCARDIRLNSYILLGKGEEATGGRTRDSIISDVMEAVIGAIFLDGGIENAKKFIYRFILSDLEDKILFLDSKTLLQEEIQKKNTAQLRYVLVGETGPDHDKQFHVEAYLDNQLIGCGVGRTKKSAEQQAAYEALLKIKGRKK